MGSPRDWMQTVKETVERIRAMIGSPDDTGGSATAGTVMGKENAILDELKKVQDNRYIKLKTFSAYVYGTDENSNPSANDGYIYPSRNFTLPSNIRIVGMHKLLASGGYGFSAAVTLKIGNTTRSISVRDKEGDYSVFNIEGALTDIRPGTSGEVTTIEEAMFAAIYLNSGHRIGTSDAERELTLKMKIIDDDKRYRINCIFYYIEE